MRERSPPTHPKEAGPFVDAAIEHADSMVSHLTLIPKTNIPAVDAEAEAFIAARRGLVLKHGPRRRKAFLEQLLPVVGSLAKSLPNDQRVAEALAECRRAASTRLPKRYCPVHPMPFKTDRPTRLEALLTGETAHHIIGDTFYDDYNGDDHGDDHESARYWNWPAWPDRPNPAATVSLFETNHNS